MFLILSSSVSAFFCRCNLNFKRDAKVCFPPISALISCCAHVSSVGVCLAVCTETPPSVELCARCLFALGSSILFKARGQNTFYNFMCDPSHTKIISGKLKKDQHKAAKKPVVYFCAPYLTKVRALRIVCTRAIFFCPQGPAMAKLDFVAASILSGVCKQGFETQHGSSQKQRQSIMECCCCLECWASCEFEVSLPPKSGFDNQSLGFGN